MKTTSAILCSLFLTMLSTQVFSASIVGDTFQDERFNFSTKVQAWDTGTNVNSSVFYTQNFISSNSENGFSLLSGSDFITLSRVPNFGVGNSYRTGQFVFVDGPRLVSPGPVRSDTPQVYTTFDYRVNNENVSLTRVQSQTGSLSRSTRIDESNSIELEDGWRRATVAMRERPFGTVSGETGEKIGASVDFYLVFSDTVQKVELDNFSFSKDEPALGVRDDLYPIEIEGNVYHIKKGFSEFDGVYDKLGNPYSVDAETAGKLLQASIALDELDKVDASAIKSLLNSALLNDNIADFSEGLKDILVTTGALAATGGVNPNTIGGALADAISIAEFSEIEKAINVLLGSGVAITSSLLNAVEEGQQRYLSNNKVVIDFDKLSQYEGYVIRSVGATANLVQMFENNADLPDSFSENFSRTAGEFVLSASGIVGGAINYGVQNVTNEEELKTAVEAFTNLLDTARKPVTTDENIDFYSSLASDLIVNRQLNSDNIRDTISSEELFAMLGFNGLTMQSSEIFSVNNPQQPSISGPGVGSIVSSPVNSNEEVLFLKTGSPVTSTFNVTEVPEVPFFINFDFLWGTETGYLSIFANDILLDTLNYSERSSYDFSLYSIFVDDPNILSLKNFLLKFIFDGPSSSEIFIKDITLSSFQTASNEVQVNAPTILMLFLFSGLLLLVVRAHRRGYKAP